METKKSTQNSDTLMFEEFEGIIQRRLPDYLPPEYSSAEIKTFTMRRLNDSYHALQVIRPGDEEKGIPVVNLDALYSAYFDGVTWDDIMKSAASVVLTTTDIEIERYFDYDYARSHLLIRVSNWSRNQDLTEELPFRRYGDIMMTYHLMFDGPDEGVTSARISNDMLESYGIDEDTLHEDALASSAKILPPVIMSIDEMMNFDMLCRNLHKDEGFGDAVKRMEFGRNNIFCLTNKISVGGAAAMFYPGVLNTISEQAGEDLYIIPSSVHEVLLCEVRDDVRPDFLKELVLKVNQEKMMHGIKLADSVYRFDRLSGELYEI